MSDFKFDDSMLIHSLKIVKHIIIFTIFIYLFIAYLKSNSKPYNMTEYEYEVNKFDKQFPILETLEEKNQTYPTQKDLLSERIIIIKDSPLTNEYINFVRPISETEEEFFKESSHINEAINDVFDMNREGMINLIEFNKINKEEVLKDQRRFTLWNYPFVSVIIPFYNQIKEVVKTIRSIQNQSLKNIEIIIVDDKSTDNSEIYYKYFLQNDPRVRLIYHQEHMGQWRSRLDGFLYSRGRYIIQYNSNSPFIDNYALEDLYYIATKYKIDSLRFSFQKAKGSIVDNFNFKKEFSNKDKIISYGKCHYDSYSFEYGFLANRLTRAVVYSKALGLVEPWILNAYKNLWTDAWWNDIGNKIDISYASVDRDGFLFFDSIFEDKFLDSNDEEIKDKIIREFIYLWIFSYKKLPKKNNKKQLILEMENFAYPENKYKGRIVTIDFLKSTFDEYEDLLRKLIADDYVSYEDKKFLNQLLEKYHKIKLRNLKI